MNSGSTKRKTIDTVLKLALAVFVFTIPVWLSSPTYLQILIMLFLFAYLTTTWNLVGGFAMGLLIARTAPDDSVLRLGLGVGVLGGFTTFSAFSLEVGLLMQRGQMLSAAGYVLASVLGAVGAMFLGMYVVRQLAT